MPDDRQFEAVLRIPFVAIDEVAAQAMGEELLRVWNEQVQPDTPSALDGVYETAV